MDYTPLLLLTEHKFATDKLQEIIDLVLDKYQDKRILDILAQIRSLDLPKDVKVSVKEFSRLMDMIREYDEGKVIDTPFTFSTTNGLTCTNDKP